jgi:hypothetical protein
LCLSLTAIYFEGRYFEVPTPLPTYNSSDVQAVCELFELSQSDEFCTDRSNYNQHGLAMMLRRNFPANETTYDEIMPYLSTLPSKPVSQCLEGNQIFAVGFCPSPQDCESSNYSCVALLPGTIPYITIYFDTSTGLVLQYSVPPHIDSEAD